MGRRRYPLWHFEIAGLLLVLGACDQREGDLLLEDLSIETLEDGAILSVRLVNPGDRPVWVRTNLPHIAELEDGRLIGYHDESPFEFKHTGNDDGSRLQFTKVYGESDLLGRDESVLQLALPKAVTDGPIELQLGWYKNDPGEPFPTEAPPPVDIAIGDWDPT